MAEQANNFLIPRQASRLVASEEAMSTSICKMGWAPKGVQSGQSGQGLVLDHSEHLPLYR
jgi:hypothetical protein